MDPIKVKGCSTCFIPAQVKIKKICINITKIIIDILLNLKDDFFLFWIVFIIRIKSLIAKAITPPNLFGIERRIAYANKKYHSGWMWTGVTIGLAGIKFSGSVEIYGEIRIITDKVIIVKINPTISFLVKNGWKLILSLSIWILIGLEDPVEWRRKICVTANTAITKGRIKWKEKNRINVGALTENPPHNQFTIIFPQTGIADIRLVITVAAQNDIWPHGRTYPIKAVAINNRIIITPIFHVILNL